MKIYVVIYSGIDAYSGDRSIECAFKNEYDAKNYIAEKERIYPTLTWYYEEIDLI